MIAENKHLFTPFLGGVWTLGGGRQKPSCHFAANYGSVAAVGHLTLVFDT